MTRPRPGGRDSRPGVVLLLAVLLTVWAAMSPVAGAEPQDEDARPQAGDQSDERSSEYTPWGFSGAYYYVRIGYDWGD